MFIVFVKVNAVDAGKQFLQVSLDDYRLGCLTQDPEQVFVNDKVKPAK